MNMGPLKLFSSIVLFGIDPHSGSVYPHSGCLCYEGMEGGTPDNRGALKVVRKHHEISIRDTEGITPSPHTPPVPHTQTWTLEITHIWPIGLDFGM